jgi:hypothetical protein
MERKGSQQRLGRQLAKLAIRITISIFDISAKPTKGLWPRAFELKTALKFYNSRQGLCQFTPPFFITPTGSQNDTLTVAPGPVRRCWTPGPITYNLELLLSGITMG